MRAVPTATDAPEQDGPSSSRSTTQRSVTDRFETLQVLRHSEFQDFLEHVGVDPDADSSGLLTVAGERMYSAALPPGWSEHVDEASSRVYFFNKLSGESLWVHPQAETFCELIEEIRSWPSDESTEAIFARSDAHLRQAHRQAIEAVSHWSAHDVPEGPEEAPEFSDSTAQFFFNSTTGESRWSDPRQYVEFDLRQRHSILCECMASHSHARASKGMSSESSDGEHERGQDHGVQAFMQNLWESIGTLPLPVRHEAPAWEASLPSAVVRRPAHLPSGDISVRSSVSYLTARSSTSCSPRADLGIAGH